MKIWIYFRGQTRLVCFHLDKLGYALAYIVCASSSNKNGEEKRKRFKRTNYEIYTKSLQYFGKIGMFWIFISCNCRIPLQLKGKLYTKY